MKDDIQPKWKWARQAEAADCEEQDGPPADPIRDFRRDPTGVYVLIRVEGERGRIALAVCNRAHEIIRVFRGRTAADVYTALFAHERENGLDWFREKTHIAYLGKELKKAELALAGGGEYLQE